MAARFPKGRSGNLNGRPKGRFRAGTRAAAALLDKEAPALAAKAIELALGGDAVAVRFCLGRLLGIRRGQPVELAMPAITYADDVRGAVAAITGAVAAGGVTPDEARALAQMLETVPRIVAALPPPANEPTEGEVNAARHRLIDALDRLAAAEKNRPKEERRAELLAKLAALDAEPAAEPAAPLDVSAAEQPVSDRSAGLAPRD